MTRRPAIVAALLLLAGLAAAQDGPFKDDKERSSYALGINLARQLRARSIEVDPDALVRGLREALAGNQLSLTDAEVQGIVSCLQAEQRARQAATPRAVRPARPTSAPDPSARAADSSARAADPVAPAPDASLAASALARMALSFKLDSRLATPTYGGERWVSPATYTKMGEGKTCLVEARVQGLDARGRRLSLSPTWSVADTDMVTVTPSVGSEVKILVQRPGETSLRVASSTLSRELAIKAAYQNDVLKVDISPK